MSKWDEVKRFDPISDMERYGNMTQCDNGDYVEFEDYDALVAHCKSLESAQHNGLNSESAIRRDSKWRCPPS